MKDYYTARSIRAQIETNFVWDVLVKGNDADVANVQNNVMPHPPLPGSNFIHNEAMELKPAGNDLRNQNTDDIGDKMLTIVACGANISKEYLGLTDKANRATALVASEPAAKHFQARQSLIEELLNEIFDRFRLNCLERGLFKDKTEDEWGIEFTFPEIAIEDRTAKLKDLATAESMNWISKETAASIAGKELAISTYDFEEEQTKIVEETNQAIMNAYAQVPKGASEKAGGELPEASPRTTPANTPPSSKKPDVVSAAGRAQVKKLAGVL